MTTEKRPPRATDEASAEPKTDDREGHAIADDAGPVPASEREDEVVPDPTL